MRRLATRALMLARAYGLILLGTALWIIALGEIAGQTAGNVDPWVASAWPGLPPASQTKIDASFGILVDRFGNVLLRPVDISAEGTRDRIASMGSATFSFVPGHYYTSQYFSEVITEYGPTGIVVGSYTVPSSLGDDVRGLAFGADGLLYATVLGLPTGFTVLALRSDGTIAATYQRSLSIGGNISFGKIAMDSQYLYVCGQNYLTRFVLGDPVSGTTIYTQNQIYDVKPLPNGHLFVASAYYIDEITTSGVFVRRIQLTGGEIFTDIRGVEYNPETNILFVTHLGHTGFFFRIMRVDAATGALLNNSVFTYADDLFLDLSGNLLVGSRTQNPVFFSQDLVQGKSLQGTPQMFVTQYAPLATPTPTATPVPTATATVTTTAQRPRLQR